MKITTTDAREQIKNILTLLESEEKVTRVNPFDEGFDTAREGGTKTLCPYRKDTAEFKAWMEGFEKGIEEVNDKKEISEGWISEGTDDKLKNITQRFKYEVKKFIEDGELNDLLYDELYDYYSNNGEMPYGVMKARTGDPYQWVMYRFYNDLKDMGMVEKSMQEDVTPQPKFGILTEESEEILRSILEKLGFEEGLDFFFDDELIVIGRDTARVVINALKSDASFNYIPYIRNIDGEEVSISFEEIEDKDNKNNVDKPNETKTEQVNEDVNVTITGRNGDEVISDIRRLCGIQTIPTCSIQQTPPTFTNEFVKILNVFGKFDTAYDDSADEYCHDKEINVKEDSHEDSRQLANSPNEKTMGVKAVIDPPADDLNKPKKMNHQGGLTGGDNPMTESNAMVDEVAAPGQEEWILANKQKFIDQYGKEKGLKILYATAWKRSKNPKNEDASAKMNPDMPPMEKDDVESMKRLAGVNDTPKYRSTEQVRLDNYGVKGSDRANAAYPVHVKINDDSFFVSTEELDILLNNPKLKVEIIGKQTF